MRAAEMTWLNCGWGCESAQWWLVSDSIREIENNCLGRSAPKCNPEDGNRIQTWMSGACFCMMCMSLTYVTLGVLLLVWRSIRLLGCRTGIYAHDLRANP